MRLFHLCVLMLFAVPSVKAGTREIFDLLDPEAPRMKVATMYDQMGRAVLGTKVALGGTLTLFGFEARSRSVCNNIMDRWQQIRHEWEKDHPDRERMKDLWAGTVSDVKSLLTADSGFIDSVQRVGNLLKEDDWTEESLDAIGDFIKESLYEPLLRHVSQTIADEKAKWAAREACIPEADRAFLHDTRETLIGLMSHLAGALNVNAGVSDSRFRSHYQEMLANPHFQKLYKHWEDIVRQIEDGQFADAFARGKSGFDWDAFVLSNPIVPEDVNLESYSRPRAQAISTSERSVNVARPTSPTNLQRFIPSLLRTLRSAL